MRLYGFQTSCTQYSATAIAAAFTVDGFAVGEWDASALATHLVMVNVMCARALDGHGPGSLPSPESIIGDDVAGALESTTGVFLSSFGSAADVNLICPTPVGAYPAWVVQTQGSLEHLIPACDITTQLSLPPPESEIIAEAATRILANTALYDQFRTMGMYAPPTIADPDASALERLRRYLGR